MSAAILAVAALILFERLRPLLIRALDQRDRVIELSVKPEPVEPEKVPDMPSHLESQIESYSTPWAREQARQAMYESFAELGDWDLVTNAFSRQDKAAE